MEDSISKLCFDFMRFFFSSLSSLQCSLSAENQTEDRLPLVGPVSIQTAGPPPGWDVCTGVCK